MAQPSFSQILEISELLKEIEVLESRLQESAKEAQKVAREYELKAKIKRSQLLSEIKQKKLLEVIAKDLDSLRQDEANLKQKLEKEVTDSVEAFLGSNSLSNFIENLVTELSKTNPTEVAVSDDISSIVKSSKKLNERQSIRVISGSKTYILDLPKLKENLIEKLIKSNLPRAYAKSN